MGDIMQYRQSRDNLTETWKPIIPFLDAHSYAKGFIFGQCYTLFIILVAIRFDYTSIVASVFLIFSTLVEGTILINALIPSFVIFFLAIFGITVVLHECAHIVYFPQFWKKNNIKIRFSFTKGISVSNSSVNMSKNRAIFCVLSPVLALSFVLFVTTFFVYLGASTYFLKMIAICNLLISAFDIRATFYLFRLPKRSVICNGNYRVCT